MPSSRRHHRSDNTYHFQTFSERLALINIDVVHRIDRVGIQPEDVETYFSEGVQKWREMHCTAHYDIFLSEVSGLVHTFPQLVYHQDTIVQSLQNHLLVPNSTALEPLLDLVVQLVRDLQKDFYPHFRRFFFITTGLLDARDPEQLEWVFTCLSYLFKFLWRLLIKDIHSVYSMYSPLLEHKKEHIRHFAAESFSFLMRKVPDHGSLFDWMFLDLILSPAKDEGVGQLLFQMCRGVKQRFHSCTEQVLQIILSKLGPATQSGPELPWALVFKALQQMLYSMACNTTRENCGVIWDALMALVWHVWEAMLERQDVDESTRHAFTAELERSLQLVLNLSMCRKGLLVTKPEQLQQMCLRLVQDTKLPETCQENVLHIVAALLLGQASGLRLELSAVLVKAVFESPCTLDALLNFSQVVFPWASYEETLLPYLLPHLQQGFLAGQADSSKAVLIFLAKLILNKVTSVTSGSSELQTYPLIFQNLPTRATKGVHTRAERPISVAAHLLGLFERFCKQNEASRLNDDDLGDLFAMLVVLPHVRPFKEDLFMKAVCDVFNWIFISVIDKKESSDKLLFVLQQATCCLLRLDNGPQVLQVLTAERLSTLLRSHSSAPSVLLLVDLVFARMVTLGQCQSLASSNLLEWFPFLQPNLSSDSSRVRFLTLRILNHFHMEFPLVEGPEIERISVFAICIRVEETPATLHMYREKLLHLHRLRHDLVQPHVPVGPYQQVPLRFLLGMLYVNFSHLWKPTLELITSYAKEMDNEVFWETWWEHIQLADAPFDTQRHSKMAEDGQEAGTPGAGAVLLFQQELSAHSGAHDRPDHANFRLLIWQAMLEFPEQLELHSHQLVPLLFTFIRQQFSSVDVQMAHTQDVRRGDLQQTSPESEDVECVEEMNDAHAEYRTCRSGKRLTTKDLLGHLKVFSKFSGPWNFHKQEMLKEFYYRLLCHRNQDVQKVALACLFTYKPKALLPYREHLERLLEDHSFKEEIVLFMVQGEACLVQAEHRQEVMQVLIRMLFGRLRNRTGRKTKGKSSMLTSTRTILQFLSCCTSDELSLFFNLLLEPLQGFLTDGCLVAARRAAGPLDLGAVVPLGRQLAVINSLESAFRDLGHTMWPFLPRLLQVLICVIAFSSQLLLIKDEVQPGLFGLIRLLRQAAHQRLSEFFVLFEFFNFSQEHIDALFEFVIWPWVSRLTPSSSSFSMALLKLASIWSKQPRYFPLFAKQSAEQPGGLLPVLFSLLGAKPTAPKTTKMVLNIVWSLLTTPDFQPSENMPSLPTGGCFSIEIVETPAAESLSLGSQLVRPHVSTLLQFLAGTLQPKGKWEDMSYNLDILSQLSGFVENEDQSNLLVGLLIPYLNKGMLSQDIELSLLEILLKLLPRCRSPSLFLQPLSRLICLLKTSPSRQKLCTLFQTMGELDNSVAYITEAIIKMNALDRRHVDDVDYDVRLQALQYAATFIGQMDPLESSYLIPVISCCFYNIQLGEMSLSDSGGLCLSALLRRLKTLSPGHPTARLLLQSYLLPNLRKGLRSETEGVQQECTRLLSDVVQILPALTESKAMLPLVNVDPEADFFENIRHIQGYRRARALTRLARRLDEGSISISPAILQGYFIPFAARMLQDDGTIKNENILVNAGIELLRAICRQLPWKQYLPILRRYQHGLHNKKISLRLSIRLLVAVLDAFHFDHETLLREEEEEERVKSSAEAKTKDDLTEVIMNEEEGAPTGEEERKDAKSNDCSGEQTKAGENPKRLQKQAVVGRPEGQVVPKGSSSVQSGRLASEKIRHTVERVILPRLLMSLSAKSKADSQHKMVKSFGPDDELVARIPLALSAVHLLQALPPFAREQQLPSILLKVCLLLRNRLERVREIARTTLSKILQVLGPPYLFYVLREMSSTLSKGYQIHVLMFTLHALLNGLQSRLQRGDLDTCAKLIQETCNRELFGDIAETKRVPGILRRVVEARACRSYAVYQTLSRFLSCGLLTKLISPLKEVVDRTGKYETIAKVQEVLRRIVQGLMENTAIAFEDLILLSHSLVTQSLPFLSVNRKGRKKETNQEKPKSCLLLPPSPKRGGEIAVIGVKTNSHVMVEFGLQVLKCSLRKRKLMGSNKKALEMLDPFVPLLCNCLESQHIPVITLSLCCLECVLSFEIPALHESSVALTRHLFSLLKNYASTGAGVGDNFVLVLSCFKTITAMLRNRKCDDLSENQLQVLLGYVEEDMHDNSRQATAFSLLKAILDRKLMVPEMNDVMKKVAQMSISSHVEPIRVQCRKVYLTFIMEYPLERKLQEHLEFIISQLEYEHDTGRESALEILMTMFKLFPEALVEKHSGVFFLPLALMLGKESGLQTRKMAGLAICGLLDRLRPNCRVPLFKLTSSWLHSPKVTLRRLAVQVCGLFADVERLHFEKNLPGLLPVLHSELEAPFDSQMNESMERASDQLLFSVLSLLSKLLHICPVLTSTSRHKIMINIWESVQRHLLHPQAWVRLQAGQLFGQLFESWTPEKLVHGTGVLRPNFLVANLQGKMEELARAFSLQLKSPLLSEELSVQIRQNILFVMKVCHHLDSALEFQENEDEGEKCKNEEEDVEELKEDGVAQGKRKCLAWILGRLSLITRSEAACTPHIMFKRTCVFHVFSNLAISLGKESTIPFLRTMLQPLFRELGNTYAEQDATLKTLALETIDKLKDVVGREEFSLAYNAVHQRVKELRVRRKMLQAQQAVSNPDIAARRKMKKHLNKIQSKKRKAEMHWVGCKRKRRRN